MQFGEILARFPEYGLPGLVIELVGSTLKIRPLFEAHDEERRGQVGVTVAVAVDRRDRNRRLLSYELEEAVGWPRIQEL